MDYRVETALKNEKCHDCGGQATIVLVAEGHENGTDYVDEVALCENCAEGKQV